MSTLVIANEKVTKQEIKAVKKLVRVIVDLNPEALQLMDRLEEETGAHSRSELFRNMLKFCAATVEEIRDGNQPFWIDKDNKMYKSPIHRILVL